MNENTPLHEHDCKNCQFLGCWNTYDLYFCENQKLGPTIIARFGKDGEYVIGRSQTLKELNEEEIPFNPYYALRIAYLISKDLGLVE